MSIFRDKVRTFSGKVTLSFVPVIGTFLKVSLFRDKVTLFFNKVTLFRDKVTLFFNKVTLFRDKVTLLGMCGRGRPRSRGMVIF